MPRDSGHATEFMPSTYLERGAECPRNDGCAEVAQEDVSLFAYTYDAALGELVAAIRCPLDEFS
jgi:hypothetical protein